MLLERGLGVNEKLNMPALVRAAQEVLGLDPKLAVPGPDGDDSAKRILGGLMTIVGGLGNLRNRYGTGHGPKGERAGLRPRHARMAVNLAMTWRSMMLDTLSDPEAPWRAGMKPEVATSSPAAPSAQSTWAELYAAATWDDEP